jgi:hypothetical protein
MPVTRKTGRRFFCIHVVTTVSNRRIRSYLRPGDSMNKNTALSNVRLQTRVRCPHCWKDFPPEDVLWISAHSELRGDPYLGKDEQQRFLPTRFDPMAKAVDVRGVSCNDLACPFCHLSISWSALEMHPLIVSILGAPGSGKSFFLSSMTWQFRQILHDRFRLSFGDADPNSNRALSDYEEKLFLNPNPNDLVTLNKTELEGDLYESVRFGEREVWYPRPFVFSVQPIEGHPDFNMRRLLSRALCLYDNAGEHFLPGGESARNPSNHLALSEALLFLFDPTQHPNFREACTGKTNDPQMGKHGWAHRQDQILHEVAKRVRNYSGWPQDMKYTRPLIVVVTKYDAWSPLFGGAKMDIDSIIRTIPPDFAALNLNAVQRVSDRVRGLLLKYAREVVMAAEGFAEEVVYIPVSALGRSPEVNATTGALGIRPCDIRPVWTEVPMLIALQKCTKRLVRSIKESTSKEPVAK